MGGQTCLSYKMKKRVWLWQMVEENWQSKLTTSQANASAYDVLPCRSLNHDFDVMLKYVKPFVDSVGVLFRSEKKFKLNFATCNRTINEKSFCLYIGVRRICHLLYHYVHLIELITAFGLV